MSMLVARRSFDNVGMATLSKVELSEVANIAVQTVASESHRRAGSTTVTPTGRPATTVRPVRSRGSDPKGDRQRRHVVLRSDQQVGSRRSAIAEDAPQHARCRAPGGSRLD